MEICQLVYKKLLTEQNNNKKGIFDQSGLL